MDQISETQAGEARRRLPLVVVVNGSEEQLDGEWSGTRQHAGDIEKEIPAWLCVLGAFCFSVPSFGFANSVGTVQSYLQLNQLKGYSASEVGWIAGLYLFLSYCLNIQIGPLCDYDGPMVVDPVGVIITILSFLLAAECKSYWHFMLCFGVLGALGGATIATVAMSVVGKLFNRQRCLAIGLALTGSAVGSMIFPVLLRATLPRYGWQWSMRIMAFTIAGVMVPGLLCFLPYRRLTAGMSDHRRAKRSETVLDFSAFRSRPFALVSLGSFLLEFAIFGIAGLLPSIAVKVGFKAEDGYLLLTILSACSFFGRALPGLFSDILGPFNVLLMTTTFTIIAMAALFVPFASQSRAALYAFSALWGFGSGSFLSLPLVCMSKTCERRDYGRFYGTMTFFVSFAVLLTVPLGSIILENLGSRALAGLLTTVVSLGGACYFTARALLVGKWFSLTTRV